MTLPPSAVEIAVNTSSSQVTLSTPAVTLPAGPYAQAQVTISTDAPLVIGKIGRLAGTMSFTRSAVAGQPVSTVLALTGGRVWIGTETDPTVSNAEGALLVTSDNGGGFAGYIKGDLLKTVGPLTIGGHVIVQANTTSDAVHQTVSVGGQDLNISFDSGNVWAVSIIGATLTIGNIITMTEEHLIHAAHLFDPRREIARKSR